MLALAGVCAPGVLAQTAEPAAAAGVQAAADSASSQSAPVAGDNVVITLNTGEVLKAKLVAIGDTLVCEHPILGTLTLTKDKFSAVQKADVGPVAPANTVPSTQPTPPPASVPPAVPAVVVQAPPAPVAATPPAPVVPPAEPSFFDKWTGTVEGGFNGADGNSNSASFRVNLGARRETPEMLTTLGVGWWYARADDRETQDRTTYDARNEWPVQTGSSWKLFVASTGEFDAFKSFDYRLTASTGLAWNFFTSDDMSATMRLGVGGTREFGPNAADPSADGFPGLDISYKLSQSAKVTGSYDGVFNLDQTDHNRSVLRFALDVLIDAKNNLGLKLGIEDRYDSSPLLARERHDLEYFALMTLKF